MQAILRPLTSQRKMLPTVRFQTLMGWFIHLGLGKFFLREDLPLLNQSNLFYLLRRERKGTGKKTAK